ncbi:hypothetical protein KI387_042670, partial [Taxus chinensis]
SRNQSQKGRPQLVSTDKTSPQTCSTNPPKSVDSGCDSKRGQKSYFQPHRTLPEVVHSRRPERFTNQISSIDSSTALKPTVEKLVERHNVFVEDFKALKIDTVLLES